MDPKPARAMRRNPELDLHVLEAYAGICGGGCAGKGAGLRLEVGKPLLGRNCFESLGQC